jgi:predicted nucleic acid-binding Zn ribbon protein
MVMTGEEILRAAARIRAAQRRKTTKRCPVCGTEFEGITTKRYCSDRCRVQAARERETDAASEVSRREERRAIVERLLKRRTEFFGGRALPDDPTDFLRAEREARSHHLRDL